MDWILGWSMLGMTLLRNAPAVEDIWGCLIIRRAHVVERHSRASHNGKSF